MTIEKAIKELLSHIDCYDEEVNEALMMAVDALREQEEHESLQNSYEQLQAINDQLYLSNQKIGADLQKLLSEQEERSKGCDFCREDNEGYYRMIGTFYLTNPFHKGEYYLNGGGRKPRKIRFCPMCGRKLEVEG